MLDTRFLLALSLFAAPALAQLPAPTLTVRSAPRAAWTSVTSAGISTTATHQRADNMGAASNDKLYVFGGCKGNNTATTYNDLWAFDPVAGTFTQLIPNSAVPAVGQPTHRGRAAVAWNFTTGRLTVFAGNTRSGGDGLQTATLLNDVWEWDPVTGWADVTPASGPAPTPRQYPCMAWDPFNQAMVVYGGQTNDTAPMTLSSETWLFVSSPVAGTPGAWLDLSSSIPPATTPPARTQASAMTRPDFGDVLLCGGIDESLVTTPDKLRFLDVWVWSGTTWTKISDFDVLTMTGTTWPASVNGSQAVYDPLRKRVVRQGGQGMAAGTNTNTVYLYDAFSGTTPVSYGGSPTNYTSEFDCITNTWSIYSSTATVPSWNTTDPTIGKISRAYCGFVPATGKVYKVCGQNASGVSSNPTYNVYQYQANPIASTASYGAGCTGPGGALSLVADNDPWTSRTWSCTATGLGPLSFGFAIVSLGQLFPGAPLPVLPIPGGGLGCELYVTSLDITAGLIPTAGSATFQLSLPTAQVDPTLPGLAFYAQIMELDFSAGWIGTYGTNGLACVIGSL